MKSRLRTFPDELLAKWKGNQGLTPFLTLLSFLSFWVNNRLFYGVDHLHFVERALGNASAALPRFYPVPGEPRKAKLTIYHDFASPWSYIGSTQVHVYVAVGVMLSHWLCLLHPSLISQNQRGRIRTHNTVGKEKGKIPRWCGLPFTHHWYHGLWVGYSKLINGLIVAGSGALYAKVQAYCKAGASVVL